MCRVEILQIGRQNYLGMSSFPLAAIDHLPLADSALIAYLENHLICINLASTKLKTKKPMGLHLKPKAEVPLLVLTHLPRTLPTYRVNALI